MNTSTKSLFLTGGTGYIGGGILRLFLKNNWNVTCAVRDISKAKSLQDLGAKLVEGAIEDRNFLLKESANHDAIIHTAEKRGDQNFTIDSCKVLLESAQLTAKTKRCSFIFCSGCLVNGDNDIVRDEFVRCDQPLEKVAFKIPLEDLIVNTKRENLRTSVIRPSWVYGHNNSNFMNDYLRYCKEKNEVITYEKDNNMCFVHVDDVASYFFLVATSDVDGIFNATDNNFITSKAFCDGLAKYLNTNVVSKEFDGLFKYCLMLNQKILTKRANEIGWKPVYANFLDNIEKVYKELYV